MHSAPGCGLEYCACISLLLSDVWGYHFFSVGENRMKEPGLDGRHRDKNRPKAGRIQQKRSDTLNENLDNPIPQFSPKATLGTMREETGKVSEEVVRREARKIRPNRN
jgi:hypothetical protein